MSISLFKARLCRTKDKVAGLTITTLVSISSRNRIRGTRDSRTTAFNIHVYWLMSSSSSPKCRMAMLRMPASFCDLCTEKMHLRIFLELLSLNSVTYTFISIYTCICIYILHKYVFYICIYMYTYLYEIII